VRPKKMPERSVGRKTDQREKKRTRIFRLRECTARPHTQGGGTAREEAEESSVLPLSLSLPPSVPPSFPPSLPKKPSRWVCKYSSHSAAVSPSGPGT